MMTVTGLCAPACAGGLPPGFVYLREVAPSIEQDMRYAGPQNFTGKPVPGYGAAECVLQRGPAEALKRAQEKAQARGLSLKVYDCYRPLRAVHAFTAWARGPEDGRTRYYYPHLKKSQLVPAYIAPQSAHSTGAAIDVTLVSTAPAPNPKPGPAASSCTETGEGRDGALDMGTAFDCFDPKANTSSPLATAEQRKNRALLMTILQSAGFHNYPGEWWHFSYDAANDSRRYDFPITPLAGQR